MAEVIWTREALAELERISAHLRQFSPSAADRMVKRLSAAADSLEHFPHRGRRGRRGLRELPTVPPYIVEYRVDGELVFIRRIRHGRQQVD